MNAKTCKRCQNELPLGEFYRHAKMADGYLSFCKSCTKARVTVYRNDNIDAARAYDALRYYTQPHRGKEARRQATQARLLPLLMEIPEQYRKPPAKPAEAQAIYARGMVAYALKTGQLKREPCVACGAKRAHGHHHDYEKVLDVVWLCAKHHEAVHHAGGL